VGRLYYVTGCLRAFLFPFAIGIVLFFVRDYRGWRRCLGYLDKIEEQPDTAVHVE
jgi:hypothetical protein